VNFAWLRSRRHRRDAPLEAGAAQADPGVAALIATLAHHGPSATIVAGANREVCFLNRAAEKLLLKLEADMRQVFGQFSLEALRRGSIDVFYGKSPGGPALLDKLSGIHRADFRFGEARLRLKTTGVRLPTGERVGFLLEWIDWAGEARAIEEMADVIRQVCAGDLRARMSTEGKDGLVAELAGGLNRVTQTNQDVIGQLAAVLADMAQGDFRSGMTGSLAGAYGEVRDGVNATVDRLSELAERIRTATNDAEKAAAQARGDVQSTVEAIHAFAAVADEIGSYLGTIDDIAFQTNLLALNAAIEAAHAGDQGRGFAIVAQEVRRLARHSADAARDIRSLVLASRETVARGAQAGDHVRSAMGRVDAAMAQVSGSVSGFRTRAQPSLRAAPHHA
jgi:methyl-accepting chemotaxis protein